MRAAAAEKNIVAAPSGLKTARLLEARFGTPYEVLDPLADDLLPPGDYAGKRILIIHQQVTANTLRQRLLNLGALSVTCATWFLRKPELAQPGDLCLTEEDDFEALVMEGNFDLLIGDPTLWRIVPDYTGTTIDLPQFPVSGKLGGT